jgi:N-methylhydantoinase A/oxoprolinase/acetone carboxylase beta subunit
VGAENGVPRPRTVREVQWPHGVTETPVYVAAKITPSRRVDGPAIVESDDTTCVVPRGWSYEIDEYGNPWMRAQ